MHYAYECEVLTTNTVSNPVIQPIKLAAGWVRHVSITFPPGCNRHVRCYLKDRSSQVLPTNLDGYYAESAYPVEIQCYIQLTTEDNQLWFVGWSVDASWPHIISILVQVEGPDEPNIWRVLEGFSNLLERFTDLLRRVF